MEKLKCSFLNKHIILNIINTVKFKICISKICINVLKKINCLFCSLEIYKLNQGIPKIQT